MDRDLINFIDYLIQNKILQPYSAINMKRCGVSEKIINYIEQQYKQKAEHALLKSWENSLGGIYDE